MFSTRPTMNFNTKTFNDSVMSDYTKDRSPMNQSLRPVQMQNLECPQPEPLNLAGQGLYISSLSNAPIMFLTQPVIVEAIRLPTLNDLVGTYWVCDIFESSQPWQVKQVTPNYPTFDTGFAPKHYENLEEVKRTIGSQNPYMNKDQMYDEMLKPFKYEKVVEIDDVHHKQKVSYIWKYNGWNKRYTKTWNLLDHVRMHEGIRPFQCKLWPKSFTQKGNLKKHQIQHSLPTLKDRKRFRCPVCSKGYTERYNLEVSFRPNFLLC
jgi:hypothetical protein